MASTNSTSANHVPRHTLRRSSTQDTSDSSEDSYEVMHHEHDIHQQQLKASTKAQTEAVGSRNYANNEFPPSRNPHDAYYAQRAVKDAHTSAERQGRRNEMAEHMMGGLRRAGTHVFGFVGLAALSEKPLLDEYEPYDAYRRAILEM